MFLHEMVLNNIKKIQMLVVKYFQFLSRFAAFNFDTFYLLVGWYTNGIMFQHFLRQKKIYHPYHYTDKYLMDTFVNRAWNS